jgi:hypothetical protein
MKHEIVIGQILAEPLDRPRLAVILWSPDSMNDRHFEITSWCCDGTSGAAIASVSALLDLLSLRS